MENNFMNVSGPTKVWALFLIFGIPTALYLLAGWGGPLYLMAAIGAWRFVRVASNVIAKGRIE